MNNRIQLPIKSFENFSETLENSNFHPVKILICHTGENFNGSVFSLDSFNKSINTLSNIPILGFIQTDDGGNKDFAGHEIDLDIFVDDDGKIKVKEYYKEIPIGVIPETNNYFFEEIDGETYLGCYGYIWKCYSNDAYDVLLEDEEKEVSMEILVKECSYDKQNRCNIDKFEFLGVTVLGAKHPGAMGREATINMNFSANEDNKEFFEAVENLNKILKNQRKEGIDMDNIEEKDLQVEFEEVIEEEKIELEIEETIVEEQVAEEFEESTETETVEEFVEDDEDVEEDDEEVCPECGKNPCECEDELDDEEFAKKDKKKKCEEENTEDEEVCPICEKNPCECEEEDLAKKDKKKKCEVEIVCSECGKNPCECEETFETEEKENFSLSINNLYRAISMSLDNITYEYTSYWGDTFNCRKYYLEDLIPNENIAIIYDDEDGNNYGISYTYNNDDVICNFESKVPYIREWRKKEAGSISFEIENKDKISIASLYEKVGEELHSLRQFKQNIEETEKFEELRQQVNAILDTFNFEEEEIAELKEKVLNREIDLEKFEDKLCVLEVKKMRSQKFSMKQTEEINSLPITDTKEEKVIGKYDNLIKQYGKKK
jgi:hypothetical protein